jgi:hypothetical protein
MRPALVLCVTAAVTTGAGVASAADATTAGQATSTYPTFQNVSIEWPVEGDDDADEKVASGVCCDCPPA